MASKHLSIGSVIQKNKIARDNVFLILIALELKNSAGEIIETIRITKNSEDVVYQGVEFTKANFDLNISMEANTEPSISISAQDQTRALARYVDEYDGLVGQVVRLYVVNSSFLDQPAEIEEEFKVISGSMNNYIVSLKLGVESAVNRRFPPYRQFSQRCSWKYKGNRCKYAGSLPSCDFTLLGDNGCQVHNNIQNYGAFPGLSNEG